MKTRILKYKSLSFEERTLFNAKFSIVFNAVLAVGKFILAVFQGVFFFVAGVFNIFILMSKLECYLGVKKPDDKSFVYRNRLIALFLMLAGLQYTIYMARLIYSSTETMQYSMVLGVSIAFVSFVELGVAIKGCFNAFGKGHYYRNIKLINLCSAFTAIVLTEIAIMSFASDVNSKETDAWFGISVGMITFLIGIYVLFAPKISIVDREYNAYSLMEGFSPLKETEIPILLTKSKVYGNYTFMGKVAEDKVEGHIVKGKSPIFKWNIFVKILICILSEILIFPYALGALIFHFKNAGLICKLDRIMEAYHYKKDV